MKNVSLKFLVFFILANICWIKSAEATKPMVSIGQYAEKASIILTAEIISKQIIEEPRKDINGNWLPLKQRLTAQIMDILKINFNENNLFKEVIQFDCGPLTFNQGEIYILFLTDSGVVTAEGYKRKNLFNYISPGIRLEATKKNLDAVINVIDK